MITSLRYFFIGFHVTKKVRDELRRVAKKRGISVSMFCYKTILEKLDLPDELETPIEELLRQ
jgi:hypothetical protein